MTDNIAQVAVPVPLRQYFDFIIPSGMLLPEPGIRVFVPFGSRQLVGVLVAVKGSSDLPPSRLKPIIDVIDSEPIFDTHLWSTLQWLASYYVAPIGEVMAAALPTQLRQAKPIQPRAEQQWRLTELGDRLELSVLKRAPIQKAIIELLKNRASADKSWLAPLGASWRQACTTLVKKGLIQQIETQQIEAQPDTDLSLTVDYRRPDYELSAEQTEVMQSLHHVIDAKKFSVQLLDGVTGSGKTELYFEAMYRVLGEARQVLFLVPEISLTPQLLQRIEDRFSCEIAILHSRLTSASRHRAWWRARSGVAKIIIGTRSAVFCACKDLGLVIIDEEHDASFKQQDGVHYHARDVALVRAKNADIPVILGSATPSLESLANAQQGRYQHLHLRQRATPAPLPEIKLVDQSQQAAPLSGALITGIGRALDRGEQALIFINRRGWSPVIYCAQCKLCVECHRCAAKLTYHKQSDYWQCHHCGYRRRPQLDCPSCGEQSLKALGQGTQQLEALLLNRFAEAKIVRIDRDSTRKSGELEQRLDDAESGRADILIGTQLISKGHDFPNLSVVGVLDVDMGLRSVDFRAPEQLFQQLVQVAGRAGRREKRGRVFIQTEYADSTFFADVVNHDYASFAERELIQRQQMHYPPYRHFALLRAQGARENAVYTFLQKAKGLFPSAPELSVFDPTPALMARVSGQYRGQLLISSSKRRLRHDSISHFLGSMSPAISKGVRWNIDIDPIDFY